MKRLFIPALLVLALGVGLFLGRATLTPLKTQVCIAPGKEVAALGRPVPGKPGPEVRELAPPVATFAPKRGPIPPTIPQTNLPPLADAEANRLRSEIAASMRESGIPEGEIAAHLQSLTPSIRPGVPEEEIYSPYELSLEELSPEEIKEQMRSTLKEAGFPPEEIEQQVESLLPIITEQQAKPSLSSE